MSRLQPPQETTGDCYSNLDHKIEDDAEERLRNSEVLSHAAWDHYGKVWFENGQFHEEVWVYGSRIAVISDDNLLNLMVAVNAEHGET